MQLSFDYLAPLPQVGPTVTAQAKTLPPSSPPSRIPVYTIRLAKESEYTAATDYVGCSQDIYSLLRPYFLGADREYFLVTALDTKHKVIGIQCVSIGTINSAVVFPREVVKFGLMCNAAALILSHNHPSQDVQPSPEDHRVTDDIIKAAQLFEIRVLDHLIVGESSYFSFADHHLLATLSV
jgi:DNA repair protein RadC